MTEYRWAVLGCGAIANQMARAMENKYPPAKRGVFPFRA